MGVKQFYHGHHHESVDYSALRKQSQYQVINVGFRSICDETGSYLLIGRDDR